MKKVISFIKKETVLTIATLLAAVSAFFIPPDRQYPGYIDFRMKSLSLVPVDEILYNTAKRMK